MNEWKAGLALLLFGAFSCDICCRSKPVAQLVVEREVREFERGLKAFRRDMGRLPTEEEGLAAIRIQPSDTFMRWKGPYLPTTFQEVPVDPWNNEYVYGRVQGPDGPLFLGSWGSDGMPGGEGPAADLLYPVR